MTKIKLKKELGLFHVFAISTGAMFSSGFFLLPGIAAQYTGPSVFIAYLLAALLIMPAMFSMAEIATALPRAGGPYFFLDRSLGPLMGTIGGLGTYLALAFKTAFAIVGIGAYAAFFWDVPVKAIAIAATLLFMVLNLIGAKKTSSFQSVLVIFLIAVLGAFIIDGIYNIFFSSTFEASFVSGHFKPLFSDGVNGLLTTTGFVFVSYLGLTQITSVAEEIKNPERNIPLGMILSLVVTALIYVIGVFVMVAVIDPGELANDLAPVATTVEKLFVWLPGNVGAWLMAGAAMAAFASTGNAGLLASSRYPFAMSRDNLFPPGFSTTNKKGTPTQAVLLTSGLILLIILALTEEGIAKLASTFMLIVFMFINFAVIVFRKSNIDSYDPGYKSPLYPGTQVAGILISLVLIVYMGWIAILFSALIITLSYLWYRYYARVRVKREGAIFHWFALLGKYQHSDLESEFMSILKDKGLRQGDPFDETIVRAHITDLDREMNFDELVDYVSGVFSIEMHVRKEVLVKEFQTTSPIESALLRPEVSILYGKFEGVDHPSLHIVLARHGITKNVAKGEISSTDCIRIFFFLINPVDEPRQQLRMLSRLIDIMERDDFVSEILDHKSHRQIKEYLLYNERFITVQLLPGTVQATMIGKQIKEIKFPSQVLVALVEHQSETFAPHGDTVLHENDVLTIIGEPQAIAQLYRRYQKVVVPQK